MRAISVLGAAVALVFGISGCGGTGVNIPEGPMPRNGSFTGVWHSPQYGEMHLVQTGGSVVGEYTKDERSGRIQGSLRGNVLRFEWSEERELVAGRPNITRGRGYFVYAIGDDGDHYIRGEWGHDDRENGGGEWNAVRDRRRQPTISGGSNGSSGEDVEEFDTAGGSTDESEGEEGEGEVDLGDL